jgi:hypothetical protein
MRRQFPLRSPLSKETTDYLTDPIRRVPNPCPNAWNLPPHGGPLACARQRVGGLRRRRRQQGAPLRRAFPCKEADSAAGVGFEPTGDLSAGHQRFSRRLRFNSTKPTRASAAAASHAFSARAFTAQESNAYRLASERSAVRTVVAATCPPTTAPPSGGCSRASPRTWQRTSWPAHARRLGSRTRIPTTFGTATRA